MKNQKVANSEVEIEGLPQLPNKMGQTQNKTIKKKGQGYFYKQMKRTIFKLNLKVVPKKGGHKIAKK